MTKSADGVPQLVVDDPFDRAWRRVGLALDRVGFTVVDRDRSKGVYFVRYADPEVDGAQGPESGFLSKLDVLEGQHREAGAVPDHGRRQSAPRARDRAGPEGRARQDPERRAHPRAPARPAQVTAAAAMAAAAVAPIARLMRFASLGSGSEGNGLVVEAGGTRVMIDCGFGVRDTAARLARLGLAPTIARRDPRHPRALRPRRRRRRVRGAARASPSGRRSARSPTPTGASTAWTRVYGFDSHDAFAIGALAITPVAGAARRARAGAVRRRRTARGGSACSPTSARRRRTSRRALSGCDALVLECNHDLETARARSYPPAAEGAHRRPLRAPRNDDAAALLARSTRRGCEHVVAAHLSQQNNTPQHGPRRAGRRARLRRRTGSASPTRPTGFDWREL